MKKKFLIILSVFMGVLDLYLLYSTIAHLVVAIKTPNIVGEYTTFFSGMFMVTTVFFVALIISTIVTIVFLNKLKKDKKYVN